MGVLSVDRLYGEDVSFEEDIRFLSIVATLIVQFVSLNLQVRAREEHLRKENLSLRVELSEKSHDLVIVGKKSRHRGGPAIDQKSRPGPGRGLAGGGVGNRQDPDGPADPRIESQGQVSLPQN